MRFLCHRNRSVYGRLSRCWPRYEPMPPTIPSRPLPLQQYVPARLQRTLLCRRVKTRVILAPSLCSSCVALAPDARRCSPKCRSTRYTISCGVSPCATKTAASSRLGSAWGKRETFCGTVTTLQTQPSKTRGNPFALLLQDDSGALICKWFQTRSTYLQERFPVGTRVGSGMVTLNGYTGAREVVHPDLEVLDADDTSRCILAGWCPSTLSPPVCTKRLCAP